MNASTHYELMVILKPDLGEKNTKEALNEIRSHLTEQGGVIQFEDIWEKRTFAYPIKSYEEGYYAIFYFDMAPSHVANVKKELALMPGLLRELFIALPSNLEIASYVASMKKREEEAEEEQRKIREEKEKEKSKREQSKERDDKPKSKKPASKDAVEEIEGEAEAKSA